MNFDNISGFATGLFAGMAVSGILLLISFKLTIKILGLVSSSKSVDEGGN